MSLNQPNSILLMALIAGMLAFACNPDDSLDGQRPVLQYSQPIHNPPDDFLILFNITSAGERFAEVKFRENAVWIVEKLGNPRYELFLNNGASNRIVTSVDTIGFEGNKTYKVVVFSAYYTEFINFFVGFRKADLDYETYPDKF